MRCVLIPLIVCLYAHPSRCVNSSTFRTIMRTNTRDNAFLSILVTVVGIAYLLQLNSYTLDSPYMNKVSLEICMVEKLYVEEDASCLMCEIVKSSMQSSSRL